MYSLKLHFVFALLVNVSGVKAAPDDKLEIVNRYKSYLLQTSTPELRQTLLLFDAWPLLSVSGQWSDIDYNDKEPGKWKVRDHLQRVHDMALLWTNPKSSKYRDPKLWHIFNLTLNHWLEKRYQNPNWWHNEIGVPQLMRDIIILVNTELSQTERHNALQVLKQYVIRNRSTGANLVWSADLAFHYGALTNNPVLMASSRLMIVNEIKITTDDGIQPDFSFHQHGARLQMYQYGKALFWESARLAWQLKGTKYAFPFDKVDLLIAFVLNGWQWMARGIHTVPGTIDRSVTRKDELNSAELRPLLPYLIQLSPGRKKQLQATWSHQDDKGALQGFRYYPYSDFSAYHNKNFSVFVKTLSSRTLTTESINNENLKGGLLNSGDTYYLNNGNEYFNLMPVWNWTALPGTTIFNNAARIAKNTFSGSVSDGDSGLTAMNYQIEDSTGTKQLHARKFWGFHKGIAVHLVAEVARHGDIGLATTVLNQSRLQGEVLLKDDVKIQVGSSQLFNNALWLYHNHLAYVFLQPSVVALKKGAVTGSWKQIDGAASGKTVKDDVFFAQLVHENRETAFGYAVSYFKDAASLKQYNWKKDFNVLHNSSACQAVQFKNRLILAAFYSPQTLQINPDQVLEVDRPCLIQLKDRKLYISDPEHKGGFIQVKYNQILYSVNVPANGTTTYINI